MSALNNVRKRGPKAPTMAGKLRLAEDRIRELYVREGKKIEEVREIVNQEFGYDANLRQYKQAIINVGIQRNVKSSEQKRIIHELCRRDAIGKKSRAVYLRGWEQNKQKIERWLKEQGAQPEQSTDAVLAGTIGDLTFASDDEVSSPVENLISRTCDMDPSSIFDNVLAPGNMRIGIRTAWFFKALRNILAHQDVVHENENDMTAFSELQINTPWFSLLREIPRKVRVYDETRETVQQPTNDPRQPSKTVSSRYCYRQGAWVTPYGKVQVFFSTVVDSQLVDMTGEASTRVVISPNNIKEGSSRIVVDFIRCPSPFVQVIYQPMIPSDFEVFQIAENGNVMQLKRLLADHTASFYVRDEEGRSLLQYATRNRNIEIYRFLLENGADPNSFERDKIGYINPLYMHGIINGGEESDEDLTRSIECHKLMLGKGADMSLEFHVGDGTWLTGWEFAVETAALEPFKDCTKNALSFFNTKDVFFQESGPGKPTLINLLERCGHSASLTWNFGVEKAILLLQHNVDLSYCDADGNNILHQVIMSYDTTYSTGRSPPAFYQNIMERKELLKALITRGADIYQENHLGKTPSQVAQEEGFAKEWIDVLKFCGYDPEEVMTGPSPGQVSDLNSKLSFEDFCRMRKEDLGFRVRYLGNECSNCGEKVRPELASFEEECWNCYWKYSRKEIPTQGAFLQWFQKYETEKERCEDLEDLYNQRLNGQNNEDSDDSGEEEETEHGTEPVDTTKPSENSQNGHNQGTLDHYHPTGDLDVEGNNLIDDVVEWELWCNDEMQAVDLDPDEAEFY